MIVQQLISDLGVTTGLLTAAKWAAAAVVGFIFFVLRVLYIKVDKSVSKEDLKEYIEDKLVPLSQRQEDIREDQREMKATLSKILDRLTDG